MNVPIAGRIERGDPRELERARAALDAALEAASVDARAIYACELVLEEWVTNVWRHGYARCDAAFGLEWELTVDDAGVNLAFLDAGEPFDPTTAPEPRRERGVAEARIGGLGLQMIRRACAAMDHRRIGGLNRLTVRIARGGPAGPKGG